jgi:hypothetical protein
MTQFWRSGWCMKVTVHIRTNTLSYSHTFIQTHIHTNLHPTSPVLLDRDQKRDVLLPFSDLLGESNQGPLITKPWFESPLCRTFNRLAHKRSSLTVNTSPYARNTYWRGRLSTVDLLIKIGCFVKKKRKSVQKTANLKLL